MIEYIVGILIIISAFFTLAASIGLYRFPDLFVRMHAASKAGTLGSGLMLLAIGLMSGEVEIFTRSIAGIIFFLITASVSAHLLARASYKAGVRHHCHTNQLEGKYRVDKLLSMEESKNKNRGEKMVKK